MARQVERRVTAKPPERTKPIEIIDPSRKGICGWCMTGMCSDCAYFMNGFACPHPCGVTKTDS